jgi:CheY-like chemotaxis protein
VPRILVADDNTNIQKMVTLAFQERGVEVIAVGNGEAAVRRIPDANPDLVLADVFMPVRNGYEVCEFVKKDTRFSHTPVILLVGAFDPLDEKEARRVGADGVLKKPFVPPDPLIAMVMSALEKNPRVAAELAKAKEVVAVVESPLPAAALENPAMAEPKPLPEFPEPTPEEAAVIYGFGKGVRAMDLDEDEEEEESRSKKRTKEAAAPKAPAKNEKAPKISTGPKTQVSVPDDDEEEVTGATASSNDDENEDQFDGSATASDWRRSAADFEVPENVAADPVYSYGKNFDPITFPSERDVPPKRVRVESKADEPAAPAREKVAASESMAGAVAPAASALTADGAKSADWEVTEQPAVQAEVAPGSFAAQEVPLIEARVSEPEVAASAPETFFAEPETKQPAESEKAEAEHKESHESAARPSFVSRVRGWMDMMSPSHSESEAEESGDHWMNKIAEPSAENRSGSSSSLGTHQGEAAARAHEPEAPAEIAARVEYAAEVHAETQEVPVVAPSPLEPIPAEEMAATSYTVAEEAKAEEEPRQFGESKFGESRIGGSSYHFSEESRSEVHDAVAPDAGSEPREEAHATSSPSPSIFHQETRREEPAFDAAAHSDSFLAAGPQPVRSGAGDFSPELLSAPADAPRNGDLAEHKPFEPLLVDEEHHEPSDYFAAPQETQQPAAREEEAPTEAPQPAQPGEDYWNHEAAAHEESVFPGAPGSIFADSVPPPVTQEFFERVPTLPPPNREALSEIPFLMPPLPTAPADSSTPTGVANADTVDEVVRRVLEKLQPQLHELLSQGVKPLIENLLQNELHKNEK